MTNAGRYISIDTPAWQHAFTVRRRGEEKTGNHRVGADDFAVGLAHSKN